MINRRTVLAGALAAPVFATRAARAAGPLTTVRVATTPDDASLSVVFGVHLGRFRDAGLDVVISQATSGAAIAAGVAGGSYDVGKSSLPSVLAAHVRNIPFTFIAPGGLSDAKVPYGHLIVANDGGIASGKDLNGKTLAVSALGNIDPVLISAWIDANGGDSKTVKFVELPQTESGAAVESHRVAGALIIHPQVDQALAGGKVRILGDPYSALGASYLISGWFATTDWVKANAAAAQTFARVLQETARYANTHHAETAPVLADFSKIALPVIQKMTRAVLGTALTPALIQPVIDASAKYNALPKAFPAAEVIASYS